MGKKENASQFIERRIVIGLIVSTDYIRKIAEIWNEELLESTTARMLAGWCITYYQQYNRAPKHDIQGIYTAHLKNGLDTDQAEDIESILSDMSQEFDRGKFNVDYLIDESMKYFTIRHLQKHVESIQGELNVGSITEAEKLAISYNKMVVATKNTVDPFTRDVIAKAFKQQAESVIRFGKALGRAIDPQCTRDAFIAFMGPEKRGKSFYLLEFAMRSLMSNCNVAFFQAGDMSENQQVKRICTYIAQKSTDEKYCDELLIPVIDCENNQNDTCNDKYRENRYALSLAGKRFDELSFDEIKSVFESNPDYKYCKNEKCHNRRSTIWFKRRKSVEPLTESEAQKIIHKFRQRYKKQFKLITYPNETLTINEIKSLLDTWERADMFVPDVVIIDYADILASDADTLRMDHRHQENKKWQRLRSLSQSRHCLLVTATQSDADSYNRELLTMDNFSETKTKYAHVTAMFGLNQDTREKAIGLMRINTILVRDGNFNSSEVVTVMQRLQIGRPFLSSF